MNAAIKREIKKQVHQVRGSHLGSVKNALSVQFPTEKWENWISYAEAEIEKKYVKA